ncbi:MAG TPA: SCP2 sterol-binding domain-containing protein [Acidimicrobiales bacterium]|nr:SCP2 sterol-binding domain-containing protein [Acidimicrobiales bacterium]
MADVYTEEWFQAVRAAINAKVASLRDVPTASILIAVDIAGDAVSPYVEAGKERHFLVQIDDGHCSWYREGKPDETQELSFRFLGPAAAFDEVAAGLLDPIDAALRGTIRVRGDMRFLMRQADHVKALLDAYRTIETTWPRGGPPYLFEHEPLDA